MPVYPDVVTTKAEFELTGFFTYADPSIAKADANFVIAGYGSFDLVDRENDKIGLDALKEAYFRMMRIVERRNLMHQHGNVQIGRLLTEYTDSSGRLWKSGMDDRGLFILAEIFNDIKKSRELREEMRKGHYLAFSIGGQALKRETRCDESTCWREVVALDLHEVTLCERGINSGSKGFIFKEDSGCFINIAKMAPDNDTFISFNAKTVAEKKPMSKESKDITPMVTKSDLQVVLDAIASLPDVIADAIKPETPEPVAAELNEPADPVEPALDKEAVKAIFEELMAEQAKSAEPVAPVEKAVTYYYKEPAKDDFDDDDAYNKAVEDFNALKEKISQDLQKELGEPLTKAPVTPDRPTERKIANLDDLFEYAEKAADSIDLFERAGVEL